VLAFVTATAFPLSGGAQEEPKKSPPTTSPLSNLPPSPACPATCRAPRSAISELSHAIAASLGTVPPGSIVGSAALDSDVPAPRAQALTQRLAEQLRGRIGPAIIGSQAGLSFEQARSLAASAPALVWLQPRIAAGKLSLTADVYPVPQTLWAIARTADPGPTAHGFAQAPIDAEVRAHLAPLTFEKPVVAKYRGADTDIVALACGDLDGDGFAELVTMNRRRVLQVELQRGATTDDEGGRVGQVQRIREASWNALAPVASAPLRQPIGFATIVPANGSTPAHLDVSLTDRAHSVRLDAKLAPIGRADALMVPTAGGSACTRVENLRLAGRVGRCFDNDPAPLLSDIGPPSDALASTALVDRGGVPQPLVTTRVERDNAIVLQSKQGRTLILGRGGAQLALGDLDQDGAPEVVSTRDVLSAKHDELAVRTVTANGTVVRRYELPVSTGIDALAICPPDGPRQAPVVLATGGELWVLR